MNRNISSSLIKKYLHAVHEAYTHEKKTIQRKQALHVSFLPPVLALQEKALSPLPRYLGWLLLVIFFSTLTWSIVGKIDIYAVAEGKIIPTGYTKTIQASVSGSIKKIDIKNGSKVKKNDILIELDRTATQADIMTISQELFSTERTLMRTQLFVNQVEYPQLALLKDTQDVFFQDSERQLLVSQFQAYEQEKKSLETDIALKKANLQMQKATLHQLEARVPLVKKEYADYEALYHQRIIAAHEYLAVKKKLLDALSELTIASKRYDSMQVEVTASEQAEAHFQANTIKKSFETMYESTQKQYQLKQALIKAKEQDRLMLIRSPIDGVVEGLLIHTLGGSVSLTEPLLQLVPANRTLEVEAYVLNKDRCFIHIGDAVQVKIESFPFTKYGMLKGKVIEITEDAKEDEKRGWVYTAQIQLMKNNLKGENKKITLQPGMNITADIKTGERRIIEYFLTPLVTHQKNSLHER